MQKWWQVLARHSVQNLGAYSLNCWALRARSFIFGDALNRNHFENAGFLPSLTEPHIQTNQRKLNYNNRLMQAKTTDSTQVPCIQQDSLDPIQCDTPGKKVRARQHY
ncbi:hypothetical protein FGO68_gene5830 [Halteria grandinella]|uniref:Uncharacterized protein n=1 Tax=Halteria grandinella TaxID=5974 RepID=A0A8J8T1F8_HALGN|nr:hypothetical protein FGO68_gene5830 [Halteria grandinella]